MKRSKNEDRYRMNEIFDFDGDGETTPEEEWIGMKFIESAGSDNPQETLRYKKNNDNYHGPRSRFKVRIKDEKANKNKPIE